MASEVTYTNRGFAVYDQIPDMYGGTVRVQESSNIEGGVWLFYDHPQNAEIEAETMSRKPAKAIMVPHLSVEQARAVIAALARYLDDADPAPAPPAERGEKMNDKKLYTWLLILVDDAGKGTYMAGCTTLDTIPIDVADAVPSLPVSGLLAKKLPKIGREVMKKIGNWREPKP